MRPSEFEATRPHIQEAFDRIGAELKRSQALLNRLALPEGTPSKVKPRVATDEEKAELTRSFRCTSRIQDAYPWRHIAAEAAVWLRDVGWITEAKAIEEVLSGLPTGPVDGNQPENMARQFDAIRTGAERIWTILAACLAGGPSPQGGKSDDASAVHPQGDQDGEGNDPLQSGSAKLSPRELASKHGVDAGALRQRLDRWRYEHDAGYVEVSNPVRNKPKYLYDESAVMPVIDALKAKHVGRKQAADKQQKKP